MLELLTSTIKLQGVLQQAAPLPPPIWYAVRGMSSIHWLWRLNRKRELYQNPDNWLGLMAGHAANYYVGNGFIRTSAHLLLVATKIQDYLEQVRIFRVEVQHLSDAIDGYYRPSGVQGRRAALRMERIKVCSWRVMKSLFQVTLHAIEVYDSLYRTDEAMNEVVLNGVRWMENVSNNRKSLVKGLKQMEGFVNKILKEWGTHIDAAGLINKLDSALQVVDTSAKVYRGVSALAGNTVRRSLAHSALGLGLDSYVPADWVGPVRHPTFSVIERKP